MSMGLFGKRGPYSKKEVDGMWLEKIALFCLVTLALVGTVTLGIIIHEYSHYNDFKELNVTDEELCGLALPTKWINLSYFVNEPAGFYAFRINNSNSTEVIRYQQISKDTEFKAYIIGSIIFIFFIFCYWIIIFGRYRDQEKILDKELEGLEKDFYIHQLESFILNKTKRDDNTNT
jgi:hypothetical protein